MTAYKNVAIFFTLVLLFVAAGIGLYVLSIEVKEERAERIKYPGFSIAIPEGYKLHGIDVSRYQHTIGWESVRAMEVGGLRIGFAFIKATEGSDLVDRKFFYNWREAKAAGIPRGAYHFFVPGIAVEKQAENFIAVADLQKGDLPPVVDIETLNGLSPATVRKQLALFLSVLEKRYKAKPIIYTFANFYRDYMGKEFDSFPLWVAHYYRMVEPEIDRPWHFWQHNDKGTVNGIKWKVDFNVFKGDSAALRQMLLK